MAGTSKTRIFAMSVKFALTLAVAYRARENRDCRSAHEIGIQRLRGDIQSDCRDRQHLRHEPTTRTHYDITRLQSFTEWWQLPLLVLACILVLAFVAFMYRRDSVELKPGIGILLAILRLGAFGGLLLMYLDIEKHSETKVVHNSRASHSWSTAASA